MSFSPALLSLIVFCYGLVLFAVAHIGEKGWMSERVLGHPIVYILSLGVFSSTWAIFGVVGLAYEYGYGYLTFYLSVAIAFVFAPMLIKPILRICQLYQLTSLADLFTFRYRSPWAGTLVTVVLLVSALPLVSLQVQTISEASAILSSTEQKSPILLPQQSLLEILFCFGIIAFAIRFGSQHIAIHERHNGLVATIAFESIIKLSVLLGLGIAAIYGVFGSFELLDEWILTNEQSAKLLRDPIRKDSGYYLLLIFFAAVFAMPNMFHMIFAENPSVKALHTARWGVPLFALMMSLPVLPILWAGFTLSSPLPPEYYSLAIGLEIGSPALAIMALIGALAAGSSITTVTTVALASMLLNHLILPFYKPKTNNLYRWLLWTRRLLIVLIVASGYCFYQLTLNQEHLSQIGFAAFIGSIQFFPGVLAILYWPRGNCKGFIAGACTGISIWFVLALLPLFGIYSGGPVLESFGLIFENNSIWTVATVLSLLANVQVFAIVSYLTKTSSEEKSAARICSLDALSRPERQLLLAPSPKEMITELQKELGEKSARHEVYAALEQLRFDDTEKRPYALRLIRSRIKANLSRLMGPAASNEIINRALPFKPRDGLFGATDINLLETRIDQAASHLSGIAADLNRLRGHHRKTLEELPVGVCSIGTDGELLLWNHAMSELTGIQQSSVIGAHINALPAPWNELLNEFLEAKITHAKKEHIVLNGDDRWISLHKTISTDDPDTDNLKDSNVIVIEDVTEIQRLENELAHNERLASIGRLAAGVAHEIGNPITGIACLAQNLEYDTNDQATIETGKEILVQTDRVSKIVQTLVNFAHAGPVTAKQATKKHSVELASCVDEAIHLLSLNKGAKPVQFINQCIKNIYINGDSQRVSQVFVNLLNNARDASKENDHIYITGYAENNKVYITVTDEGSGIAPEYLESVFEPFYTTKEAGEGTGLGLALVYSIIEEFGGHIHLESPAYKERNCGTQVSIELPEAQENSDSDSAYHIKEEEM